MLPFPVDRPPQPAHLGSALERLNEFLTAETVRHAWLGSGAMATYAPIAQDLIAQDPIAGSAWIAIAWIQPESVARLRIHAEAEHWQVSASTYPLGSSLTLVDTLVDPETTAPFTLIPVSDGSPTADPGEQGDRPIAPDWPEYAWAVLKRREVLKRSPLGSAEDREGVPIWIATPEDLLLVRLLESGGDRSDTDCTGAIRSALGNWWRSLGEQLDAQQSGGQQSGGQRSGGQQSGGQRSGGQRSGGQRSGGQRSGGQQSGGQRSGGQRRLNVCYVQEWSDRLGVATRCDQVLLSR